MFDSLGVFTRQFTPVEGGYLYYPSRKAGGKLVTAEEFQQLVSDWQRVAGTRGRWMGAGLVMLAIASWIVVSANFGLSDWADRLVIFACVAALSGRILWASLAPRRLVRDRAAVAPPRPASEARREARAALSWPFIIVAFLFTAAIFFGNLGSSDRTVKTWIWLVVSGAMFVAFLWIGFEKLRDRSR